jgi:hypothetical protein
MNNVSRLIVAVLAIALAPAVAIAADDDAAACERLILDYAWHWDHNNHEDFANLFTVDADFRAAGRAHNGRAEILEEQSKRTGNVVTRMFFSNIRVTAISSGVTEATSYFMVHSEPAGEAAGTIATRGFRIIGENLEDQET